MSGWMMSGWGAGYGLFTWLLMLLLWILIIVGAVTIARWLMHQRDVRWLRNEETPLEILKKRYATGEISKEQFESMKRDLG
jgi:putative membrane protein